MGKVGTRALRSMWRSLLQLFIGSGSTGNEFCVSSIEKRGGWGRGSEKVFRSKSSGDVWSMRREANV